MYSDWGRWGAEFSMRIHSGFGCPSPFRKEIGGGGPSRKDSLQERGGNWSILGVEKLDWQNTILRIHIALIVYIGSKLIWHSRLEKWQLWSSILGPKWSECRQYGEVSSPVMAYSVYWLPINCSGQSLRLVIQVWLTVDATKRLEWIWRTWIEPQAILREKAGFCEFFLPSFYQDGWFFTSSLRECFVASFHSQVLRQVAEECRSWGSCLLTCYSYFEQHWSQTSVAKHQHKHCWFLCSLRIMHVNIIFSIAQAATKHLPKVSIST